VLSLSIDLEIGFLQRFDRAQVIYAGKASALIKP
jgi:ethanolamine utilization microcompartment shell protein EutS